MNASIVRAKSKASSSSNRWLARQSSDPYVRARQVAKPSPSPGPKSDRNDSSDSTVGSGDRAAAVKSSEGTGIAYRSRASYKLLEIWKKYPGLMRKGGKVVDLGAAPGGWSQVASEAVTSRGTVVGIDLLPVVPLERVTLLQGDFLSPAVQEEVSRVLAEKLGTGLGDGKTTPRKKAWWSLRNEAGEGGEFGLKRPGGDDGGVEEPARPLKRLKVDTVLSDMMCNISGIRDRDVAGSLELCESALSFATGCLKVAKLRTDVVEADVQEDGVVSRSQVDNFDAFKAIADGQALRGEVGVKGKDKRGRLDDGMVGGGCLVLKHFQHPDLTAFQKQRLNPLFRSVKVEKPKSSRSESSEAFFVCVGYKGVSG